LELYLVIIEVLVVDNLVMVLNKVPSELLTATALLLYMFVFDEYAKQLNLYLINPDKNPIDFTRWDDTNIRYKYTAKGVPQNLDIEMSDDDKELYSRNKVPLEKFGIHHLFESLLESDDDNNKVKFRMAEYRRNCGFSNALTYIVREKEIKGQIYKHFNDDDDIIDIISRSKKEDYPIN
jgi:hypothetical protein